MIHLILNKIKIEKTCCNYIVLHPYWPLVAWTDFLWFWWLCTWRVLLRRHGPSCDMAHFCSFCGQLGWISASCSVQTWRQIEDWSIHCYTYLANWRQLWLQTIVQIIFIWKSTFWKLQNKTIIATGKSVISTILHV